MADKRTRTKGKKGSNLTSKTLTKDSKKTKKGTKKFQRDERKRRKTGPHLPSSMRKELDGLNADPNRDSDGTSENEHPVDLYEYDEPAPQEESTKNRRYDPVDNFEYELPDDFKDENIASDDDEEQSEGEDRHQRMLEGITGMPGEAFAGKGRKRVMFSDSVGMEGDDKRISIKDLLEPLQGKPGYSKLNKRLHRLEKKTTAVLAPLPKVERERIERKVAYEHSKKDITKWEPLVKRNREASTLFFDEDVNLGFSTVGAIASVFEPRSEFEKKMALLVRDPELVDAHRNDGSKILELNEISIEDERERRDRLAKMRSILFRHEIKLKHIKKIKSKTYHRLLKKERTKAASTELNMDPEAAKEYYMKQERKRAQERMTLKHKNNSKWARRIIKRGMDVQDEGTRAARAEQLHQHALLTRKMETMKDSDSDSDHTSMSGSSDDEAEVEFISPSNAEGVSKILNKAKGKISRVMEEEGGVPKSGLAELPFMKRAAKSREEAVREEARLALQEYDSSLKQLEDGNQAECPTRNRISGRKVFGEARKKSQESSRRCESKPNGSEDDEFEEKEHDNVGYEANQLEEVQIRLPLHDESESGQEAIYKAFDDIIKDPGPKTTYDVAIFASDSWRKMKDEKTVDETAKITPAVNSHALPNQDLKVMDQNSDSDSDKEMVDGILTYGVKPDYELPSQMDLIHSAFAGDDVEAEFDEDKMVTLNEEIPEPEKPTLIPGWGQWTHIQEKKGMPSWMLEEHEKVKRKREEALKKRKDAHLKHVIISERTDKKAEKLHAKALPYPYTSKEVYEQSIRMPIGPEFNPAISARNLNRPAVVKRSGLIIKPIQYEEVDPHKTRKEPKGSRQKPKKNVGKS